MPVRSLEHDAMPGDTGGELQLAPGVRVRADAVVFSFASSSGPGGQNVNKRATKAELRVRLDELPLTAAAARRLADLAGRRLTTTGELIITGDEHRSQERNREECLTRLREILVQAMTEPRIRRPTKPSRGSKMRRLETKRRSGDIKKKRRHPGDD